MVFKVLVWQILSRRFDLCTVLRYYIVMDSVSVNQFRAKLREHVERVASEHEPIKVTRRNGVDFVVMSLDDWEQEQETLYVLSNKSLIKQIVAANKTHGKTKAYKPSATELDEILSI